MGEEDTNYSNTLPQSSDMLDDKTSSHFINQIHLQQTILHCRFQHLPNTYQPIFDIFPGEEGIQTQGLETKAIITDVSNNVRLDQQQNGDWVCVICGNLNFSFRTSCNRCHKQTKDRNSRLQRLIRASNGGPSQGQHQPQPKQITKNSQIHNLKANKITQGGLPNKKSSKNNHSCMTEDKENVRNNGSMNCNPSSLNIFAQESKNLSEKSQTNKLSSKLQEPVVSSKNLRKQKKKLKPIDQNSGQVEALRPQSVPFYPQNENKIEDHQQENHECGGQELDENIRENRGFNSILLQLTPQKGYCISNEEKTVDKVQCLDIQQIKMCQKYEMKEDINETENDQDDQRSEQEQYVNSLLM